jgi:hypothetical protein
MDRRDFLKGLSIMPAAALASAQTRASDSPIRGQAAAGAKPAATKPFNGKKPVGIQIGARSFVDEGVDKCLDTLQDKGAVNWLLPTVFTYGRGLAGRQVPGRPLPDHGGQEYDEVHGGSYARVHPEFYAGSVINPKDIRAPELGDFDILADVTPKAKARGMEVYLLFEEVYNPRLIPNFEQIAEVDVFGRSSRSTCLNNPHARNFIVSMVEDWFKSNQLDGLMWESERQGPLNNMLGMHFGSGGVSERMNANCFCQYCMRKGKDQGIDVTRAKDGYIALGDWVKRTLHEPRTPASEGTFVSLWRLFVQYPEILAWHKQWFLSQEEVYALIYGTVKAIDPDAQVGWHIMQYVTLSPFFQADQDYARMTRYADYLKPCPYNNAGGPRFATYIQNVQSTIFRDMAPEQVLDMHYKWLGLTNEATLDKLPTAGLSAEYVARETRRAKALVKDAVPIYPGIDIDIPTALKDKQTTAADVKAATLAAFKAGAAGVVLSRKYAEMKLTNIAGAGAAIRELGLA